MSSSSVSGARVVEFPRGQPCPRHCEGSTPIRGAVGTVDRIDEHFGEHRYVVVSPGVLEPSFAES
jgi:hypothetical protein